MTAWTCSWSMAGVWLVKTGPSLAEQLSFHREDKAKAHLIANAPALREALEDLFAVVRGECPSLLNEDSGGDGELSIRIEDLLSSTATEQHP